MPSIIVISGPNKGDYYPLAGKRQWSVGRLATCDIQIVDDAVSRDHCTLEVGDSGLFLTIRDRESSHGTLVNGRRIAEPVEAKDGDQITVGESTIVVSSRDFPDRESALKDQHLKRWFSEEGRQTLL